MISLGCDMHEPVHLELFVFDCEYVCRDSRQSCWRKEIPRIDNGRSAPTIVGVRVYVNKDFDRLICPEERTRSGCL